MRIYSATERLLRFRLLTYRLTTLIKWCHKSMKNI